MIDDSPLDAAFAQAQLPGAVTMIVNREGVVQQRAFGLADHASGAAMAVDSICQIASMTKALVSVAAMQLVERGLLDLDAPVGPHLPDLAEPQVLTGFDAEGRPQTSPAMKAITARHLLTHTAGLGYAFVQSELLRWFAATGAPRPGTLDALRVPLLHEPGEDWQYGVATDWLGLLVQAISGQRLNDFMAENIFGPLGMTATAFRPALPEGAARVHMRTEGGGFKPRSLYIGGGEFDGGGGGLTGNAPDYGRFIRMILNGGELDGQRVLKAETVAEMARNQVAPLRAGHMGSSQPEVAGPFDVFPDQHTGWGLGFLINPEAGPNGRSPGSLAWAGIFNCFYWIDPAAGLGGMMLTQLSPFGDPGALGLFGAVERLAYGRG
ncbi:MAG: beta-lactamase family protein [Proteobacteria bacterium]|nr:beta-lactamase family protein [Pseudomonadota bacterium]